MPVVNSFNPAETVAVHGTSVEVALHYLKTGQLARLPFCDNPQSKGTFHFAVNPPLLGRHADKFDPDYPWTAVENHATYYAQMSGVMHFLFSRLGGIDNDLDDLIDAVETDGSIDPGNYLHWLDVLSQKTGSPYRAGQLLDGALQRQGVRFGFSSSFREFEFLPGPDPDGNAAYIEIGSPIDSHHIIGVQALGTCESEILRPYS